MADVRIIGRVGIKVIPEVENRRPQMRRDIERQLDDIDKEISRRKPIKIPAEVDGDAIDKDVDDVIDETEKKKLHLKVGADYDDVLAAIQKIRSELKNIEREKLTIDVDSAALNNQLQIMRDRLNKEPVKMRVSDDLDGAQAVLKKIADIRREASMKDIEFNADEASLDEMERQVKERISRLNTERLHLDIDRSSVRSMEAAIKKIDDRLAQNRTVPVDVDLDDQSLLAMRERLHHFIGEQENNDIDIPVNLAGTSIVAARLAFLTRPRVVTIFARVNGKSLAIAEGLLRSLAGLNVLQRVGTGIESIIRNFDKFAVKSASWMTAIGNLGNVLTYMVTSLFTIGGGVSQIIGLAALIPTLAASSAAVFTVVTMGFNNFMQSFSDIPIVAQQALAKLPPAARRARDEMAGLWTEIRDPVQNLFWEELGTSLQDFANRIVPEIGRGLLRITPAVARFTKNVLSSFDRIARNGQMEAMFDNLSIGFDNLAKGAKPFFDALNTLGFRGSQFLPRMGEALADMAKDFDEWIQRADEAGDINRWIEEGIQSMQDMGGTIHALGRQFAAFTRIVDDAGGTSLTGFRINMERWARVMEGEPFKSRMTQILRGARTGASELNEGFKDLLGTIGASSDFMEILLRQLGELGGGALKRVADAFRQPVLQIGVVKGVEEIIASVDKLGPAAEAFGRIIGRVFDTGGTVIENLVPLLNTAFTLLDDLLRRAAPGLEALSGPLSNLLRNVLILAAGPLTVIADAIGNLGVALKGAPGGVQALVVALTAFVLLRGRLAAALTSFATGFTNLTTKLRGPQLAFAVENNVRKPLALLPTHVNTTATRTQAAVGRLRSSVNGIGTTLSRVGTAISGFMALGGGLVGTLAIGGVFTLIAMGIQAVGDAAAKRRDDIEAVKETLDDMGRMTARTDVLVASMLALKDGLTWDGNKASIAEVLEGVGSSGGEALRALRGTEEQFGRFVDRIKAKRDELAKDTIAETGKSNPDGIMGALIGGSDTRALDKAIEAVEKQRQIIKEAQQAVRDVQQITGGSFAGAKSLTDALEKIGDEAATSDEKLQGLIDTMDFLQDGQRSIEAAAIAWGRTIASIGDDLAGLNKKKINWKQIVDASGGINLSPTDVNFEVSATVAESFRAGLDGAMKKAMAGIDMVPDAGKLTALRSGLEQNLADLRAKINLEAGPEALAAFDRWLQGQQLDPVKVLTALDENSSLTTAEKVAVLKRSMEEGDLSFIVDANTNPANHKIEGVQAKGAALEASSYDPKLDARPAAFNQKLADASNNGHIFGRQIFDPQLDARPKGFQIKLSDSSKKGKIFGKEIYDPTFDANQKPFTSKVSASDILGGKFDRKTFKPDLDANPAPFNRDVGGSESKGRSFARKVFTPSLDANPSRFNSDLGSAERRGAALDGRRWTPTLAIGTLGLSAVATALATLRSFRSRYSTTMTVKTVYQGGPLRLTDADGSITYGVNNFHPKFQPKVQFMANGGFSKPTSAHIAPAGSYVTYAEQETGGEAFIPLASSKRGRSTAILGEVARMFGYSLMRGQHYADGGITTDAAGKTINVTYNSYNPVAQPESKVIETTSQHLALLGGI